MDDAFPPPGSTKDAAWTQHLATGPYRSSPEDRVYTLRFKPLAGGDTVKPLFQTRIAKAGELILLERDGDWQKVTLRSSSTMQADIERMADDAGYVVEIVCKVWGDPDEIIESLNLSEATTGVPGCITISTGSFTNQSVKWSAKAGRNEPGVAVMLAGPQPPVTPDAEGLARQWVSRNHDALVRYWWCGDGWMHDEVIAFVGKLRPITATCTRCRQHTSVMQLSWQSAVCESCEAYLAAEPAGVVECPFEVWEREQVAARRQALLES